MKMAIIAAARTSVRRGDVSVVPATRRSSEVGFGLTRALPSGSLDYRAVSLPSTDSDTAAV
jgi:hypothetical protein